MQKLKFITMAHKTLGRTMYTWNPIAASLQASCIRKFTQIFNLGAIILDSLGDSLQYSGAKLMTDQTSYSNFYWSYTNISDSCHTRVIPVIWVPTCDMHILNPKSTNPHFHQLFCKTIIIIYIFW